MYRIFTIAAGVVTPGGQVERFVLSSGDAIAAIVVGEQGRGRRLGVLPVAAEPPDATWMLQAAALGQTKSGRPRLVRESGVPPRDDFAIVVMLTKIGYRGGNDHTGDRVGDGYAPFPGRILVEGEIAQGAAGRMGGGKHIIALVPKGAIFRTAYYGRLYGAIPEHYYVFDGRGIKVATLAERELAEVF